MGAALATINAVPRSGARECQSSGGAGKPAKAAKKAPTPAAGTGTLLTADDIAAAVAWRTDGIGTDEIAALAATLRPYASDFRASRPDVAAILGDLRRPGDRRGPWSLACALLALDARRRGDVDSFWAAGLEVVKSMQQGRRGSHGNRITQPVDALDALITAEIRETPGLTASAMFDRCAARAGVFQEVLIEYVKARDELVCQLAPGAESFTDIGRAEFERRVRRARHATVCT